MSITLLNQIEEAEKKAAEIRTDAGREARDIVKSVEEAVSQENRQAQVEIRDEAQAVLNKAKVATQDEIHALEVRRSAEREKIRVSGTARVAQAGSAIFERVVVNGAR